MLILIPLFRAGLVRPLARRVVRPSRVAVVGSGPTAIELGQRFRATPAEPGGRFVGRFGEDPGEERSGGFEHAIEAARTGALDRVVLALDVREAARGPELMDELALNAVEVEWVPDVFGLALGRVRLADEQGIRCSFSASSRSSAGTGRSSR